MFTRRRFLGSSGVGLLTLSGACCPLGLESSALADESVGIASRRRAKKKDRMLGYPINMNTPSDEFFAWRQELYKQGIDAFAFNNVGNPYKPSPIPFNTHDYERKVIGAFGSLFAFPEDDTWGFLSHSGTDSNMHGMYMGRTVLKGRTGRVPRVYFTPEAHYSVQILSDLLGLDAVVVETLPDGGMDPDHLSFQLADHSDTPALVVATIGTTFKGAIDRIDQLQSELSGYESFLHLDAALFGGYLPFTRHAPELAYRGSSAEEYGRYDSIAVSCHKFFGFPSPAGLFITTKRLYTEFNSLFGRIHDPEYIHHVPGTITCSRDAVKPAEFHHFTTPPAIARMREDAGAMLDNAGYLLKQLHARSPERSATRANSLSNTIYFKCPSDAIVRKYSLATMHLSVQGRREIFAHVVVMPHVTRSVLDRFLDDLDGSRAA